MSPLKSFDSFPQTPLSFAKALEEFDLSVKKYKEERSLLSSTTSIPMMPVSTDTEKIMQISTYLKNSSYGHALEESLCISPNGAIFAFMILFKTLNEKLLHLKNQLLSFDEMINIEKYTDILMQIKTNVLFNLYKKTRNPSYLIMGIKFNYEKYIPTSIDPMELLSKALSDSLPDTSPILLMVLGKINLHCSDIDGDFTEGEIFCKNAQFRGYNGPEIKCQDGCTLKDLFLSLNFDLTFFQ